MRQRSGTRIRGETWRHVLAALAAGPVPSAWARLQSAQTSLEEAATRLSGTAAVEPKGKPSCGDLRSLPVRL